MVPLLGAQGRKEEAKVSLVAPEDVGPAETEAVILARPPDEPLVVDVARGLDGGGVIEQTHRIRMHVSYRVGDYREDNGNNVSEKEKQAVYGQRKWPLCPSPSPSPGPAALPCSPSVVQHYQICRKSGLVRRRLLSVEHSQEPARCWSRSLPAGPRVRRVRVGRGGSRAESRGGSLCTGKRQRARLLLWGEVFDLPLLVRLDRVRLFEERHGQRGPAGNCAHILCLRPDRHLPTRP